MSKLEMLFLYLQITQALSLFNFSIPVIIEVYLDQLENLVGFSILKPDPLLQLYDKDLSVEKILNW